MKLPRWTELEISYFSEELVYFPALHIVFHVPSFICLIVAISIVDYF